MARLERPLSWHATSTSQMTMPTYYQQPATMHTTPSTMGRSSYDWPEDSNNTILSQPQPSTNYYSSSSPYSAPPTTQQESSFEFSHPIWVNPAFDNTVTYPLAQVNFPYQDQAYGASQNSQTLQMTMPYSNNAELWQQYEVPGLEDDASPSVEDSPVVGEELVGLGLYDKTVRTSTDLLGLGVKSLKLTEGWTPPGEQSQSHSAPSSSYVTPTGHHNNLPIEQQKPSAMTAQQAGYPFDLSDHSFLFNNDSYGAEWYGAQQMGTGNNGNGMPFYG